MLHYGAIGSSQYDSEAIKKEKDFKNDITIGKAFELFSADLNCLIEKLRTKVMKRAIWMLSKMSEMLKDDVEWENQVN